MPALTPDKAEKLSLGNRDGVLATFSSIANADTWATGLGTCEAVFITNGASGATLGATYSGGTVTFAASTSLANVKVLAIGFK